MSDWKILVADDEPEIHSVTRMVLDGLVYKDRGIELIEVSSGKEAMEVVRNEKDIAAAIIDVVMESEDSGLRLVQYIREELNNSLMRIMLRTGQPGNAPRESVILNYDINDYRDKTDLSAEKLKTSIISCLRSYDDIQTISTYKEGLEKLVAERTKALEAANKELRFYMKTIEADLEAGSKMQYKLLPHRNDMIGEFTFSRYLLSSMYLSGDFVDYFPISPEKTGFYILDVSGHGTSSAFMTVIAKNFIDKQLDAYIAGSGSCIDNPEKMARYLNTELMREDYGKYFTMFYGVIDEPRRILSYVNCGQFPFPVIRTKGEEPRFFSTGGPAIGLFGSAGYTCEELPLPPEFQMLLVSDGILEYLDHLSLDQRKELIRSSLKGENAEIPGVMKHLGIGQDSGCPDDITFLLIGRSH